LDWTSSNQTLASLADEIGIPGPRDVNRSAGEVQLSQAQQQQLKQWALDNGYDGIQYRTNFTPGDKATEVVLYNINLANRVVGSKAAAAIKSPVFAFPADLSKSAPRYGMATVEFGSDLDRAAYMLRDGAKKSKGEDRLISALEAGGYDVAAIRAHGNKVKQAIKQAAGGGAAPQEAMKLSIPDQGFGAGSAGPQSLQSISAPIRFNTGWESVDGGLSSVPTSNEYQRVLKEYLTTIVKMVAGDDGLTINFADDLTKVIVPPEWGGDGKQTANSYGSYNMFEDIITISGTKRMDFGSLASTAYHEAWHRVQFALMTKKDMDVFDSVFGRWRLQNYTGSMGNRAARIEVQAVAFQTFVEARQLGLDYHGEGMRSELVDALDAQFPRKDGNSWEGTLTEKVVSTILKVFDRSLELVERLNNAVRLRGFTSVDDIFQKAYSGRLARERAISFAIDEIDPGQVKRTERLKEWMKSPNSALNDISGAIASIDERVSALKSQALAGGC
jgi:hypothetical protein